MDYPLCWRYVHVYNFFIAFLNDWDCDCDCGNPLFIRYRPTTKHMLNLPVAHEQQPPQPSVTDIPTDKTTNPLWKTVGLVAFLQGRMTQGFYSPASRLAVEFYMGWRAAVRTLISDIPSISLASVSFFLSFFCTLVLP